MPRHCKQDGAGLLCRTAGMLRQQRVGMRQGVGHRSGLGHPEKMRGSADRGKPEPPFQTTMCAGLR